MPRAIDLMLKYCYVMNLDFYLGWKYAFRYIEHYVYNIPPQGQRTSIFSQNMYLGTLASN